MGVNERFRSIIDYDGHNKVNCTKSHSLDVKGTDIVKPRCDKEEQTTASNQMFYTVLYSSSKSYKLKLKFSCLLPT